MRPKDGQPGKEDRKREHEENSEMDREEASQPTETDRILQTTQRFFLFSLPGSCPGARRQENLRQLGIGGGRDKYRSKQACRDRPSPTVPNQGTPPLCHQPTPRPMLTLLQLDSEAPVTPDPGPEMKPRRGKVLPMDKKGPSGGRIVPAQARPGTTWESQERKPTGTWTLPTPP